LGSCEEAPTALGPLLAPRRALLARRRHICRHGLLNTLCGILVPWSSIGTLMGTVLGLGCLEVRIHRRRRLRSGMLGEQQLNRSLRGRNVVCILSAPTLQLPGDGIL